MKCVCGRPIQKPDPVSGYDLDWVHEDGEPFCEESGHLDEAGDWHDPPFAEPAQMPPMTLSEKIRFHIGARLFLLSHKIMGDRGREQLILLVQDVTEKMLGGKQERVEDRFSGLSDDLTHRLDPFL